MSGMSRFLSRREKRSKGSSSETKIEGTVSELYAIFSPEETKRKTDKEEEKKVRAIIQRLTAIGITNIREPQVEYALRVKFSNGDPDKAFGLLVLFEDTLEGIIKEYNPHVKLLGAENRESVTCYLDALLFAMFARLDSFEAMLYDNFSDSPRKKLAALLRLWVNMLRTGRLVTVDITRHLQEALAACGWEDAKKIRQQDASEAFTFITGKLELPLLTLKMDIYHVGREDAADDHKFVNERLLEVAIPTAPENGAVATLEDCLETYFNNRIEVRRHLQRRNTAQSVKSVDTGAGKGQVLHIETVEVSSRPSTPIAQPPQSNPASPVRPTIESIGRADSIFNHKRVDSGSSEKRRYEGGPPGPGRRRRTSTMKREVLMPAWQFFSLIPWYTDNAPTSDAQVAAHFSTKRPVLGICLKRYSMSPSGTPQRLDTHIDIPLEIGLPHFISDDHMKEEGPLFGNFKLSLQSVVCHRGVSLNSGHYISLIRGQAPNAASSSNTNERPVSPDSDDPPAPWMRFDDLAQERVSYVDIAQALKEELPYLLFYQVQPIDEELARGDPPSYEEANGTPPDALPEKTGLYISEALVADPSTETLVTAGLEPATEASEMVNWTRSNSRGSLDVTNLEDRRGRTSMSSNRRSSVTFDESSVNGSARAPTTAPTTPADESKNGYLAISKPARGPSKSGSKSRRSSLTIDNRLSLTMSRLAGRMSRDKFQFGTAESAGMGSAEVPSVEETPEPMPPQTSDGVLGRSKSKKTKDKKRLRSSSRLRMEGAEEKSKKNPPDRECVVM